MSIACHNTDFSSSVFSLRFLSTERRALTASKTSPPRSAPQHQGWLTATRAAAWTTSTRPPPRPSPRANVRVRSCVYAAAACDPARSVAMRTVWRIWHRFFLMTALGSCPFEPLGIAFASVATLLASKSSFEFIFLHSNTERESIDSKTMVLQPPNGNTSILQGVQVFSWS